MESEATPDPVERAVPFDAALPRWEGVSTRTLRPAECLLPSGERELPLVVEPVQGRSVGFVRDFLRANSAQFLVSLARHGAILLRGFDITAESDFEDALASLTEFRAMDGYFMEEPGRTRVDGTRSVFYTNRLSKTGGGLKRGGFHSECYRSPDVPAVISFWCRRTGWWGGETALVHMANAYDELDEGMRDKFQSKPFLAKHWSLCEIADRYGISLDDAEEACRASGLPVITQNGVKLVMLFKPSVFVHPITGRRSLQVNLAAEFSGLAATFDELFGPYFTGPRWTGHRLLWRYPQLSGAWQSLKRLASRARPVPTPTDQTHRHRTVPVDGEALMRMGGKFSIDEVRLLAFAMWRHTSAFSWKRGDVLVIDNCLLAHAGMPGAGPRELRILLGNSLSMDQPVKSGLFEPAAASNAGADASVDLRFKAVSQAVAAVSIDRQTAIR